MTSNRLVYICVTAFTWITIVVLEFRKMRENSWSASKKFSPRTMIILNGIHTVIPAKLTLGTFSDNATLHLQMLYSTLHSKNEVFSELASHIHPSGFQKCC